MKRTTLTFTVLSLLVLGGIAHAQAPSILAPPQGRPFTAWGALGGAIGLNDFGGSQFALEEGFGYHFTGRFDGPAIGLAIQEAFGSGVTNLRVGPRFFWDIQPAASLALLLSPYAQLGLAYATSGGGSGAAFDMQFGFDGKLVLGQRGWVFFRPMAFDIAIHPDYTFAAYLIMFGGGAIF
jgi:hypothetical protein